MGERALLSGLVRLHILHHAAHEPIFGVGIIEELGHHGYRLSPGTLYPLLHGLEALGYVRSRAEVAGNRRRRVYVITSSGRKALAVAKTKVWELFRELFEDELHFSVDPYPATRRPVKLQRRAGSVPGPARGRKRSQRSATRSRR